VSLILYDQTQILHDYHPQAQRLSTAELISPTYEYRQTFTYLASLVRNTIVTFPHDQHLIGASMTFDYDDNFRLISSSVVLSNNVTLNYNMSFDEKTGRLKQLKNLEVCSLSLACEGFFSSFDRVGYAGGVCYALNVFHERSVHQVWLVKGFLLV
jgi:hypothetical protein